MREYFTVFIKENDTSNLGLLTEKLNDGYDLHREVTVGRSTLVILAKWVRSNEVDTSLDTVSYGSAVLAEPPTLRF